jgi:hypothetical protein
MDQVRQVLSYRHYSYPTEKTYCNWIVRFLKLYYFKIHTGEMGKKEIEAYISHLAIHFNVLVETVNQTH